MKSKIQLKNKHLILDNFFPLNILHNLNSFFKKQCTRKISIAFPLEQPDISPLYDAALFAKNNIGVNYNQAILKSYLLDDEYISGAYEKHIDPSKYLSNHLFLCTLTGEANLTIWIKKEKIKLHCKPNRLILLNSIIPHKVSPPINSFKKRTILFFGVNSIY